MNIRILSLLLLATATTARAQQDSVYLNTVTVTGTRTPKLLGNSPVVTQIITAADIKKLDATNIKDVLTQELPGVEFTLSMNQQVSLSMQGLGGLAILFLVDGERLAGETLDNTDFLRLNTDDIERIEIIKGAASALYGSNSVGAVINIITRKATEPWQLNLNTHYGSRYDEQRHGGTLGLHQGRWNSLTSVQTNSQGGYLLEGKDGGDDLTVYGNHQWNFKEKLSYQFSRLTSLTARAGYYFHERNSSATIKDRARDYTGGLRLLTGWGDDRLEVSYTFDRYDKSDFYADLDKDFIDYKNTQNTLRLLYTHPFSKAVTLTVGGDAMNDYLMSYQFEDDGSRSQQSADLFAQAEWALGDHWIFTGGGRLDYFSKSGWFATPRLAAMYKDGGLRLRASYSGGFKAPTLKEMYMDFNMGNIFNIYGNPDLTAERSNSFSLSGEYTHRQYSLTATGYYNIMDNEISTIWNRSLTSVSGSKGAMEYHNIGGRNLLGVDVNLMARYAFGLSAKLAYAYFHEYTRGNQPNTSASRPHSLTAKVDYRKAFKNYEFDVILSGRWLSKVDYHELTSTYDGYEPTSSPGYTVWKLALSQRIYQAFNVILSLDNLFNYRPKSYAYNSPLTQGTAFTATLAIDVEKLFK